MSAATRAAVVVVGLLLAVRALRPGGSRGQPVLSPRFPRRRAMTPGASDWATFLDTTSTEVRSGSSLIAALTHAHERHPLVAARLASNVQTDSDVAVVAQSISAALELGGPVAATLHHGAALLRERAAQRAEARAHSAQARLSAKVLTAVPMLFAAWSAATSATFRDAITSRTGLVAATTGVVMNVVGWWWMRSIVNKATT